MIQAFEYGQITIADQDYSSDVLVFPNGDIKESVRSEEHKLKIDDLEALLNAKPEAIVIGLGTIGHVKVDPKVKEEISSRGIQLHAYKTEKAVETYRDLRTQQTTAALFHLKD